MGHPGPLNVYMAKAPSTAATFDGSGKVWFKIHELHAIIGDPLDWEGINQSQFNFTIPKNTPPGEYLLRIEHIGKTKFVVLLYQR